MKRDVMKLIKTRGGVVINRYYAMRYSDIITILENTNDICKIAIDSFVFGYIQGTKATKAEMKKKLKTQNVC